MIEVLDKEKCAGCGACLASCPTGAIEFYTDEEGFDYPTVRAEKCIECGLCEKTCPWQNQKYTKRINECETKFYAAQLKDKKELFHVSSGGAAWALALYIIKLGGVVYGVVQENVDTIFHDRCEKLDDLKRIRRSKYLQSDMRDSFVRIKKDLETDRLVLFTGTGCQVAGLLSFLKKDFKNLITADIVCHGVPSPRVWNEYKSENEEHEATKMTELVFRDKSKGWLNNQYAITYSNGMIIKEDSSDNPFHRGYLFGLYNRPSCGACIFNLLPRVTDFTFADYWMYNGKIFQNTLQQGVSLVAINTLKAGSIIGEMSDILEIELTTRELALKSCRHMNNAPLVNENRAQFWKIFEDKGFYAAWDKYIKEKPVNPFVKLAKKICNKLLRTIRK